MSLEEYKSSCVKSMMAEQPVESDSNPVHYCVF
jgi:hypothetical protein